MSKITVIGGYGYMGAEAVRWLIKHLDAEIVIAGRNREKARKLSDDLKANTSTQFVNVEDPRSLSRVMKDTDIVLSTVGPFYKHGVRVLKAAINAGVDFLDIDDDYDASRDCLGLDEQAKRAGVTAIIGVGASPGVTNILAKYGADRLDRVDEIHTFWCESFADPTGFAAMDHWVHIISGNVPTYRNGRWIDVPALSEPEIVDFPILGEGRVCHVGHAEPVTIPQFIRGLKVVTNKGGLLPNRVMTFYRALMDLGFGNPKEFRVRDGVDIPMKDLGIKIVRAMPHFAPETFKRVVNEAPKVGIGLKVKVMGEFDAKETTGSYACAGDVRPLTAIPLSIAALMVLREDIKEKGVFAPEGVIESETFLRELKMAGVEIHES
jgi:saccharopine dehydrogenase (NAD+, L-lysine-forming)